MERPNLLIGIPNYRSVVTSACAGSLLRLQELLIKWGLAYEFKFIDDVDIVTARNIFGSLVVQDPAKTHVLFYDDDMDVEARTPHRLLAAQKSIIAVACPRRQLDIGAALDAARNGKTNNQAVAAASDFGVNGNEANQTVEIRDGMCVVPQVGMAVGLIAREVFTDMIAGGKLRTMRKHRFGKNGLTGPLYGFFDRILTDERDVTEDYSFCERATACGHKVWAIVNEDVGHRGPFTFRAKFSDLGQ